MRKEQTEFDQKNQREAKRRENRDLVSSVVPKGSVRRILAVDKSEPMVGNNSTMVTPYQPIE